MSIVKKTLSALKLTASFADQKSALSSRHVETEQALAELRVRCDDLAVEGGEAFERACTDIAAMQVKLTAEASAIQKLDAAIAAEEAAKVAAEKKALRDQAAAKVKPWLERAKALYSTLVPLLKEAQILAEANDGPIGIVKNGIVGREGQAMIHAPLNALWVITENLQFFLNKLEGGDDDYAKQILEYQPPSELQ